MPVDVPGDSGGEWAGRVILLYGGLLALATFLYVSPAGSSPEATFIAIFGMMLLLIPSFAIAFAGYWLVRSPFEASYKRRVLNWCGWGSLGMASLGAGLVLYLYWIGYPAGDLGYIVLLTFAAGGAIGVGFGMKNEGVRRQSEQLARSRQTILFLNRLLRHNVLNATNVIDGYANFIRSSGDTDTADDVDPILAQSERITTLVEEVRVLCDSITGDLPIEPMTLSRVLEDVVDSATKSFPETEFTADIEPDVVVSAHSVIDTAFENVLWNAVEHNDSDAPRVRVSLEPIGDEALVRVRDNGPGIPEDEIDGLFEPGEYGNSGIGFFLVGTMMDHFGGAARVAETGPDGTTVEMVLPLADRDLE